LAGNLVDLACVTCATRKDRFAEQAGGKNSAARVLEVIFQSRPCAYVVGSVTGERASEWIFVAAFFRVLDEVRI